MIIDSLTHVTPDGQWFHTDHDASESRLLRELDDTGVDHAVVVALADYISNEFVLELCNRNADRLIPGASFNPVAYSDGQTAAAAFRSQLQGSPFSVLKLHPRLNGYDLLDSRVLAVLDELACWPDPMPVWLCTFMYVPGRSLQRPYLDTLREIAVRYPNLKIVMLHAGGTWALHLAEAVRDCPNVFLDLSFTLSRYVDTSIWSDLRYLARTFDRRMIFGSDFPEVGIGDALRLFERLSEGLATEKKENILGANLDTLLSEEYHGSN